MSQPFRMPPLSVTRKRPLNLDPRDELLFQHEYEKKIPECTAHYLSKVRVLPNGYIVRRGLPLSQSFSTRARGLAHARRAAHAIAGSVNSAVATRIENALFATDEFSNGFFHWVCDVLPRLEILEKSGETKDRTLVVPAMASFPYVASSLAAYDIPSVVVLKDHEAAFCDRLMVIPPVAPTGNYRPDLMQAIRERFRVKFPAGGGPAHLFISRSEAPKRRIANEGELAPTLKRHGLTPVIAESLSFEEQVRLIGCASLLVGSHGAGLSHMLWLKPGSCVVELRRRADRWNNCYFSLASALDLKYFYLECDPVNQADDFHSGDIVVDPVALDGLLSSLRT
jgi:capsular polysaccharide biosynthesis protein